MRETTSKLVWLGCTLLACSPINMPAAAPEEADTEPLCISGVYPHLSVGNKTETRTYSECGIGAVVPWAGRLWYLTYAPHEEKGSSDKLYSVTPDLALTIHPESVGGTPAGRMIHRESRQLIIGPYLVDEAGTVRSCAVGKRAPQDKQLNGRITAIARHLTDPAAKVYVFMMEGPLVELDVRTLETRELFRKPVPGWHGKGAYTAQGRLVIANNGEAKGFDPPYDFQVPLPDDAPERRGERRKESEDCGVLAEWDGTAWRVVMRRQFCEVTGPGGIHGAPSPDAPLWATGWDKRSVLLQLLDEGTWSTFRLPKSSYAFDAWHGWYTEWPRIREIGGGRFMMTMHGAMFDFPGGFSARATGGIRQLCQHLRYVPDFCDWNGRLVIATDEVSTLKNPMAGQNYSNLWFGTVEDLASWGTPAGFGGPWLGDAVAAGRASDPFLVAGFHSRCLHLANRDGHPSAYDLQVDATGAGTWTTVKTVTMPASGYTYELLPADLEAEWVRLVPKDDGTATAYLHQYQSPRHVDGDEALFAGLARVGEAGGSTALLRPAGHNCNLMVLARTAAGAEVYAEADEKLAFRISDDAERATEVRTVCALKQDFSVDAASVVVHDGTTRLRLPKGPAAFDARTDLRAVREVESERLLANIHGTFYEVPRDNGGKAHYHGLRPVASHDRAIADFCTWRGLLVMSGLAAGVADGPHVRAFADGRAALWFGAIDDLWKLGKPVGVGGPWNEAAVKAGEPSDPYLMTGYDRKRLALTNRGGKAVTFAVQVDVAANHVWLPYATIAVAPGATVEHVFPDGFAAHWIRFTADTDCTATAVLHYE